MKGSTARGCVQHRGEIGWKASGDRRANPEAEEDAAGASTHRAL